MAAELLPLKPLFDTGKLGWLLNVGTLMEPTTKAQYLARSVPLPPKLFSHNDQQSFWQSSGVEGSTKGWGGAMGDLFLSSNATSTFTCINASGNAVFLMGDQAVQYQISNSGAVPVNGVVSNLFGSAPCSKALNSLITRARTHWMEAELNRVASRSITAQATVKAALGNANALPFTATFDTTQSLGRQLQMVARLIAGRSTLGAQRQIFFVSIGGFDNHDFLLTQHPGLLGQLASSLSAFQSAMTELGLADQVTTFTAQRLWPHSDQQRRWQRPRMGITPPDHGRRRSWSALLGKDAFAGQQRSERCGSGALDPDQQRRPTGRHLGEMDGRECDRNQDPVPQHQPLRPKRFGVFQSMRLRCQSRCACGFSSAKLMGV